MINKTQQLVLHPRTEAALEQFKTIPSHSLLLVGPKGAGKTSIAKQLIVDIVGPLKNNPYFLMVSPDNNTISIEVVRQLQSFVRLKTSGKAIWRRAILVEDAQCMTIEAQNAFLKLLEEPPADTLIILTVINQTNLLATIISRAPEISIKAVAVEAASQHFEKYDPALVARAYHISGGQMGLMTRLLDEQQNQDLLKYIDAAKQLLQLPVFDRLVFIDQYLKQKDSLEDLLWALLIVSQAALNQAAQNSKQLLVQRWQNTVYVILDAQDALPSHPLPKLLLTDLSLQM
jgi:hypothetical protein